MLTNVAGNVRVETGKDNVTVGKLARLALADDHVGDLAHGGGLLPADGVLVRFTGGARRGTDGVEDEGGMLGEEQDEALADGARGTEDTCMNHSQYSILFISSQSYVVTVVCVGCGQSRRR